MGYRWENVGTFWDVKDARVVAILDHDGGAVVETDFDLRCYEGRHVQAHKEGDKYDLVLAYELRFSIIDGPAPDAYEAFEARIVISGTHEPGGAMEIRGRGWIGYDDQGNLEGFFLRPPYIRVDDAGDDSAGDAPQANEEKMTDDEWLGHIRNVQPRPPEQFLRAVAGRHLPDAAGMSSPRGVPDPEPAES